MFDKKDDECNGDMHFDVGSSVKKKPKMNFNLMLNFDKLDGFETPG